MSFQINRLLIVKGSFVDLALPMIKDYVSLTKDEPDCEELTLYVSDSDQHHYVLEGRWKNEIAYLYHIDQVHYRRFLHSCAAMLTSPAETRGFTVVT